MTLSNCTKLFLSVSVLPIESLLSLLADTGSVLLQRSQSEITLFRFPNHLLSGDVLSLLTSRVSGFTCEGIPVDQFFRGQTGSKQRGCKGEPRTNVLRDDVGPFMNSFTLAQT